MADSKLESKHHYDIWQILKDLTSSQLRTLGCALGLSYSRLERMTQSDLPNEMIAAWLRREDDVLERSGQPTWNTLACKLKDIGQTGKSDDITQKWRQEHISSANSSVQGDGRVGISYCQLSFACTELNGLNEEEKRELHQQLYSESIEIMFKFQDLFSKTTKSLKARDISGKVLAQNLNCLGSLKPIFDDVKQHPLRHQLPTMKDSEIDDAMDVVNDYCSFFNYHIVEHIINKFGTEQDKENLSEYKKAFNEYASNRHVFKCPTEVGKLTKHDVTMFVTLDKSHDNSTVCALDLFVSELRVILKIPPGTGLKLCHVTSESLKLTFQLPVFVIQDIFPLSLEQETELSNNGVSNLWFIYQFRGHQKQELSDDLDQGSIVDEDDKAEPDLDSSKNVHRDQYNFTVEEKPVEVNPVKTEIKKEATNILVTKAEKMPHQPTTATWNLHGIEVCGEMTVVVYSSHYQQVSWSGYGLSLHIPKSCLPAGMEQCTINIKASLGGQYEFPESSCLVSAVFWLRCETAHKFIRPITLEIQHCAGASSAKLRFMKAFCSQKQLPYTFKPLVGGSFSNHSSYGVIELNSFSGVGITQDESEDKEYCSQLFYLGQPNLCQVHFVVTWNLESHLTVVREEYKDENAVIGVRQLVEFDSDAIILDIPTNGISINGWKITPLIRPVVTKKQVDNFKEGRLTPCCQILAEVSERTTEMVPFLRYQVVLKGAKYPNDYFTLNLPMEDPAPNKRSKKLEGDKSTNGSLHGGANVGRPETSGTESIMPELKVLLRELRKVASEWEDIGIELDIEEQYLRHIKSDNIGDSKACLREMLRVWLRCVAPPPLWSSMANALDTLGHHDTAAHLRLNYCQ